jgi:trimeric autotransporter adhesin
VACLRLSILQNATSWNRTPRVVLAACSSVVHCRNTGRPLPRATLSEELFLLGEIMNSKPHSQSPFITRQLLAALVSTFSFCVCDLAAYAQNTIYTVAGGGSVNGAVTGPNADFAGLSAVAKDGSGNVYVADRSSHAIYKVDGIGKLTVFAGLGYPTEHPANYNGRPANQASLNAPSGVAADKAGNVYIADTVNYMVRQVALNGLISTIAGNAKLCKDPTTACGDGGVGRAAQLNYPIGVATDAAGNVYIADTGDNKIRVVNVGKATIIVAGVSIAPGTIQTVVGTGVQCTSPLAGACGDGGAATSAQLSNPQGVAVDTGGNIYVSDSGDRRIRIVATSGTISVYAGSGNPCNPNKGCGDNGPAAAANFSNPFQIALDASGNLLITDPPENRIREVSAGTQIITTVAGTGLASFSGDGGLATAAGLNGTRGVAVDASGNVVIADTGNQRVRQFIVGGNINTLAGGGNGNDGSVATSAILGAARGVALDSAGNLYIADTYNNRIREVTPSNPPASYGTITTIVGTGIAGFFGSGKPALTAELNFPSGVALDSANNLYIADTGNFVIRQYNPNTGRISNFAGIPQQSCKTSSCGDGGPALQATFGMPTSVALDTAGNVYMADAGTHRIRVVNTGAATITIAGVNIAPGAIQTVAGDGTACANPAAGHCGDGGPSIGAQLKSPFGVAVDGSGNIFIADTGDNRIREVVAATGNIVAYAFTGGRFFGPTNVPALNSQYNTPHYVAVDPHGNLYVSSSDFDFVVERIDAVNHYVIPVAGVATDPKFYGFDGDGGVATAAHLNNSGLAIDGAGHLYIADSGNNRVREVLLTAAATPSVTTLNFPAEPVGTTSPSQNFVLTNGGSDDLYITSTPINGPFALQNTSCANNVVPPRAACTFSLTFTPVAVGPASGLITVNDNAFGSPSQTVTLNGTGQ